MSHFFSTIWYLAERRGIKPQKARESRAAFRKWVQGLGSMPPQRMMKSYADKDKFANINPNSPKSIGKMFMYVYDPKHKETLPYYDTFPLIFVVGPAKGGFYGINFHYLPIPQRLQLMDALYTIQNNQNYDDNTRIKMSYKILKGTRKFKWFLPCFKHYLYSHVRSPYHYVEPKNWEMALMLPVAKWKKQPASAVHTKSKALVKKKYGG